MRYFVIFLVLTGFVGIAFAQNLGDGPDDIWMPACLKESNTECDHSSLFHDAIARPFAQSDSVAVGTVIQKENQEQNSIEYSISVNFYLKNYQPFDLLTATLINDTEPQTWPEVLYYNSPVFNEGDLVFIYLKKSDGQYNILPESFALDKQEARGPPPTILLTKSPSEDNFKQGDEILVSGEVRKMELVKAAKDGEQLDVKLDLHDENNQVIFSDSLDIDVDGSYNYDFQTSVIPPGKYELRVNYGSYTTGDRITIEFNPSYWTPLKQFESGISLTEIKCKENLTLLKKTSNGLPICVSIKTGQKLLERKFAQTIAVTGSLESLQKSDSKNTNDTPAEKNDIVYPAFANGVTKIINPKHESLRYYTTIPVIGDTYLSKSVKQWSNLPREQLEAEHEKYPKDFYRELGRLLMKNEMQYQMNSLGIENADGDFEVIGGMILTSLPPHVGFSTVVYATDGHYYLLQGMTNANKVNYHSTTQLQYPKPLAEQPKIPDETEPKTTIMMKGDNDLKTKPSFVVLHQPGDVEFYNDTPETLTIHISKDGAPESEDTQEISVDGGSGATWTFTEPGSYSWRGKVPVLIEGKEYELNASGGILVLVDDMSGLSKDEQMDATRTILMASGLPLGGMGKKGQEDTLYIHFDEAIEELLPESRQYYLQAAQQMIPFDIKLELDR